MPQITSILPTPAQCRRAIQQADAAYDGRFYAGRQVDGVHVYCRPWCRAPAEPGLTPAFYASAGAAHSDGRLPCYRCQADGAPSIPEWVVADASLVRGLRLLASGFLNERSGAELATRLDLDETTLVARFQRKFACTPAALALLQRAYIARLLLCRSGLSLARVAYHAGCRNVAQMRREVERTYAVTPGEMRHSRWVERGHQRRSKTSITLSLPLRLPYNFDWLFGYLQKRALPGVEEVSGGPGNWCYQRLLNSAAAQTAPADNGSPVWLQVKPEPPGTGQSTSAQAALQVTLPILHGQPVYVLLHKLARVFDVAADGQQIHKFMLGQTDLAGWAAQAPGLRVAGAWDGYETAVRAVLGQQVSVARGTVLANKMISQYGQGWFPEPVQVKNQQVAELGMPGRRGRAVAKLAELVDAGTLVVDETQDYDELQQFLQDIEGIGPWTANYVRMRVLKDVDAFPDNDWVVLKQLQCTAAQARRTAQAWRPWRAYALMYLWYASAQGKLAAQK